MTGNPDSLTRVVPPPAVLMTSLRAPIIRRGLREREVIESRTPSHAVPLAVTRKGKGVVFPGLPV